MIQLRQLQERLQELQVRRQQLQVRRQQLQVRRQQLQENQQHLQEIVQEDIPLRGLTAERIGEFKNFVSDQTMLSDRCIICLDDLKVGMQMVRLDCHVDHYLCRVCADGWFKDHNTCPTCRHEFV